MEGKSPTEISVQIFGYLIGNHGHGWKVIVFWNQV